MLASNAVVSLPAVPSDRCTPGTSGQQQSPETTHNVDIPRYPQRFRLHVWKLSHKPSMRLAFPYLDRTDSLPIELTRRIDLLSAPLIVLLDFLCYLFDGLLRKPATIDGYIPMIAPVYIPRGFDLSSDRTVSDLCAVFRTQRPQVGPSLLEWNLAFVLYCLTKAPWEPLETASREAKMAKTCFLTLLASAMKRSDVHACEVSRVAAL